MTESETQASPSAGEALSDAFLDLAVQLWWLWLVVGAVALIRFAHWVWADHRADRAFRARIAAGGLREKAERERLERSGIAEIDSMDGRAFERYLRTAFLRLGYLVDLTKYRGDYGADLVIRKDGYKTAVQAKRYSKSVGVKAIQEAVAAKGYYAADAAMVVTNRFYTPQARVLARKNDVTLWDRKRLISILLESQASAPAAAVIDRPPVSAAVGDDATCVMCGVVVSEKVRAYCADHSERFGGAIFCFRHQRGSARSA